MKHLLVFTSLLACAACSKPEEKPRRTEPWLANPSASGTSAANAPTRFRYVFSKDSRITFSVPGKKGALRGRFSLSQGTLELDPREPKSSRARIDVDLSSLVIDTEVPEGVELGAPPTTLALQWLELGADVPTERRDPFKLARFELTSVEGPSYLELGKAKGGTRATAVGTLQLHGFRAPIRAEVRLSGGGTEPLSIRSTAPLVVPLATHDITARNAAGIADTQAVARAADWVGKNARVELELVAEPVSKPK